MNTILFFNQNLKRIYRASNRNLSVATIDRKLNDNDMITIDLFPEPKLLNIVNETRFLAVYLNDKYYVYRITSLDIRDIISMEGINIAIDELKGTSTNAKYYPIDASVNGLDALNDATVNSPWVARIIDESDIGNATDVYYDYQDLYTTLQYLSNKFQFSFSFSVDISNNEITNRYIDIVKQEYESESDIKARYVQKVNTESITAKIDLSEQYTAIRGLGKISDEKTGQRLSFINVNTEASPKDIDYIKFPELKEKYPTFNNDYRIKTIIYDDIEDAQKLYNTTYNEFVKEYINRDNKQFTANVVDIDIKNPNYTIKMGDFVLVKRIDLEITYITKIIGFKYDLLNIKNSSIVFGNIVYQTTAKRIKKIISNNTKLNNKLSNLNNKYNNLNNSMNDLNNKYIDLNNRVTALEGGSQPEPEPGETNPQYFTYNTNTEGKLCINGLSPLGQSAVNSGEIVDLVFPRKDPNGQDIFGLHFPYYGVGAGTGFSNLNIAGNIYIKNNYITITATYSLVKPFRDTYCKAFILQEADDENIGMQSIYNEAFDDFMPVFKFIYLPKNYNYHGQAFRKIFERASISSKTAEIDNSFAKYYTQIRNEDLADIYNNYFMINSTKTETQITGLYYGALGDSEITIPDEIAGKKTRLLGHAFDGYSNINTINVNNSQTIISEYSFSNISNLRTVNLSSEVQELGNYAFYNSTLKSLNIGTPSNLTTLGEHCFNSSLIDVIELPNSIESIGASCFANTLYLNNIILPSELRELGAQAFQKSAIKSIDLSELELFEIKSQTFIDSQLENIIFPENLKTIRSEAFKNTKITNITIPKSVTVMEYQAFSNNSLLNDVIFEERSESDTTIKFTGIYVFANNRALTHVVLPNYVDYSSASDLFFGCSNLVNVTFPSTWTQTLPSMFVNCYNLANGNLNLSGTNLRYIAPYSFYGTNLQTVLFDTNKIMEIDNNSFRGSQRLTTVTLKSGSIVRSEAFNNVTINYV